MTTVLLDSHVLHWWGAEAGRLSRAAARAISSADDLAVASISWYELAWLARNEKILIAGPVRAWLTGLAEQVRTVVMTPTIAETAASMPATFPKDPVDRIIYATAIEQGWSLVSKDERMRAHPHPKRIVIW